MTTLAWSIGAPRPLRRLRMPFLVAFAAAALAAGLGRAVTTSYLPLLLERIADAPGLIGMVMLVNAAAGAAVPLVVGVWSDRLSRSGRGRRMPFIVGGSVVTAGGLLAMALGFSSSYLMLAVFAAIVYTGLNSLTTAHRALIPDSFDETGRARATSAQELAMLGGGLVGLAAGGLLFGIAPWAPFAFSAVAVPLLALPTISRVRERADVEPETTEKSSYTFTYYLHAVRRPGVGAFLLAQILWVMGYAALPAFFLLYAEDVLSLEPGVASLLLAGFGLATGAAIAASGKVRNPALHRPLLLAGVVLLGAGFLGVAATTSLPVVGAALVVGATGFGLVSTLGFPLFSKLIPPGEAGGYTALYFSVRAISSTIALPAAGFTVAATGSYRALFVLGGVATLAALVPLVGVPDVRSRGRAALALVAAVPVLGLLVAQTSMRGLDHAAFEAVNGLGPGPQLLWDVLDPHTRNYGILIGLAIVAAALSSPRLVPGVFGRVFASALLAWGLLEAIYAVYDRPRPEETLVDVSVNGHSWAHLNSFPSGHMAITAALAVAIALRFPRLRVALVAYIAAVAFTRVMFGAHFPLDTIAGTALGTASALLVAVAIERFHGRVPALAGVEPLRPDARIVAIMPSHNDVPSPELVETTLGHVDTLVLVDDGSDPDVAAALETLAGADRVELMRLQERSGKGSAVREAVERARDADAVLVIDADAQHPADAIPAFVAAANEAELVIGDRFHDLDGMPLHRRHANRFTRRLFQLRTGHAVRDTQNGMRLMRGRALDLLPEGGFEAETRHLRRALHANLAVAWVPIPALYGEDRSSFRTGRDSLRVLWAVLQPRG